jgi:hypothetical protein
MVKFVKGALLTGVVGLALTGVASATPSATDFKCEASVSKAGGKFVGSKTKCAIKCYGNAWKVPPLEPFTDCMPPYAGGAALCVIDDPTKPGKSAEEAFVTGMRKSCDTAVNPKNTCPSCYNNGDCSVSGYPNDHEQFTEGQIDTFGPLVFCELGTATKAEQKCQLNAAKVLSKYAASADKCYDKCNAGVFKGTIPAGNCNPPSPADSVTSACISKAQGSAITGVDKACSAAIPSAAPACQTTQACTSNSDCTNPAFCDDTGFCAGAYLSGALFVNLVDLAISNNVPLTYCESPSGAFVE